jgi:hypothetical protein
MKVKKLLDKLKDILSEERKVQLKKYSSLKKVLKSLRAEKTRLEVELKQEKDEDERQEIESRLKIISAQRKKGIKVLKELKRERKKKSS